MVHCKMKTYSDKTTLESNGLGCSSVGRAFDHHVDDAGSIAWCSNGFSSQSQLAALTPFQCQLAVQTFFQCPNIPVCSHMH